MLQRVLVLSYPEEHSKHRPHLELTLQGMRVHHVGGVFGEIKRGLFYCKVSRLSLMR